MLYEIKSTKTIDRVCQDLEKAVVENKFGVMTVHNLKETMKRRRLSLRRGVESSRSVIPPSGQKSSRKTYGTLHRPYLCRRSVFTEDEKLKLATLRPTALISKFNVPDL